MENKIRDYHADKWPKQNEWPIVGKVYGKWKIIHAMPHMDWEKDVERISQWFPLIVPAQPESESKELREELAAKDEQLEEVEFETRRLADIIQKQDEQSASAEEVVTWTINHDRHAYRKAESHRVRFPKEVG